MITCCKDCVAPKRHPGCHDHCDIYIEEKRKHDELREKEGKINKARYDYIGHRIKCITRYHRTHGLRKNY